MSIYIYVYIYIYIYIYMAVSLNGGAAFSKQAAAETQNIESDTQILLKRNPHSELSNKCWNMLVYCTYIVHMHIHTCVASVSCLLCAIIPTKHVCVGPQQTLSGYKKKVNLPHANLGQWPFSSHEASLPFFVPAQRLLWSHAHLFCGYYCVIKHDTEAAHPSSHRHVAAGQLWPRIRAITWRSLKFEYGKLLNK